MQLLLTRNIKNMKNLKKLVFRWTNITKSAFAGWISYLNYIILVDNFICCVSVTAKVLLTEIDKVIK